MSRFEDYLVFPGWWPKIPIICTRRSRLEYWRQPGLEGLRYIQKLAYLFGRSPRARMVLTGLGMDISASFSYYRLEDEMMKHILFQCPRTLQVCQLTNLF